MTLIIYQHDQPKIRRICNHEAGHYVVSRELGFTTCGISAMFQLNGHSGEAGVELWRHSIVNIEELISYIERRVQILYAGAIAEAMDIQGNYNSKYALDEWRNGGSTTDYAKIRELVHILRDSKHPNTKDETETQNQLNEIDNILVEAAGEIVHKRIELIYRIGNLLFQKVNFYDIKYELTESEINEILTF